MPAQRIRLAGLLAILAAVIAAAFDVRRGDDSPTEPAPDYRVLNGRTSQGERFELRINLADQAI